MDVVVRDAHMLIRLPQAMCFVHTVQQICTAAGTQEENTLRKHVLYKASSDLLCYLRCISHQVHQGVYSMPEAHKHSAPDSCTRQLSALLLHQTP